jgi:hypothetical protein
MAGSWLAAEGRLPRRRRGAAEVRRIAPQADKRAA